jgi:hypothetical protein
LSVNDLVGSSAVGIIEVQLPVHEVSAEYQAQFFWKLEDKQSVDDLLADY